VIDLFHSIAAQLTPGAIGIWVLVIVGLAHLFREWRLTRKLSLDDRIARRDGYAAQVTSLTAENRSLRTEMDERDVRHADRCRALEEKYDNYRQLCEATEEQHRGEILRLMDEGAGFKRRLDAILSAIFRLLPDDQKSAIMIAAAERVDAIKTAARDMEVSSSSDCGGS
jgi:DNA repair exonuclease SbcCD ATPase subunit